MSTIDRIIDNYIGVCNAKSVKEPKLLTPDGNIKYTYDANTMIITLFRLDDIEFLKIDGHLLKKLSQKGKSFLVNHIIRKYNNG